MWTHNCAAFDFVRILTLMDWINQIFQIFCSLLFLCIRELNTLNLSVGIVAELDNFQTWDKADLR